MDDQSIFEHLVDIHGDLLSSEKPINFVDDCDNLPQHSLLLFEEIWGGYVIKVYESVDFIHIYYYKVRDFFA